MKINSHNEWDKLKEVIVGRADSSSCLTFQSNNLPNEDLLNELIKFADEAYPKTMIDEVNEDLEEFCNTISKFGATVLRPDAINSLSYYSSPFGWASKGNNIYNVRDLHLVVGDNIIESASAHKFRYYESFCLYNIWYRYFKEGCKWIIAPKPKLNQETRIPFFENNKKYHKLTENEILFEAANTIRMGKDLIYLVSGSGNYLGAKWLQSVLGEDYRVHTTEGIYRSAHLDSTLICLRPGLVLLNAERVNEENCPPLFKKWEKIYFSDVQTYPQEVLDFHNNVRKPIFKKITGFKGLGVETNLDEITTPWTGMNVLSLDPETVIVDVRQEPLIKLLEKYKFNVIPLRMRHQYTMLGAFHCTTLDTVRESKLESYFD